MQHSLKLIDNFNKIYEKQITLLKQFPECYEQRFVEQACYIYDSRKIGTVCNPLENLKLYYMNIERNEINEINNLSFYFGKSFNNKLYYFTTYFERNEIYVEICIGGLYIKTFLTSWLQTLKLKKRERIAVEYI